MAARAMIRARRALASALLAAAPLLSAQGPDAVFAGGFESWAGPSPGPLAFQNQAAQRIDQMLDSNYRFDALFVDFNNDGCKDAFIFSHADWGATSRLWLNRCDGTGTFTYASNSQVNHNIAAASNPLASGWLGALDFDGDGRQDYWSRHGNAMGARYRNGSQGGFLPWFTGKENACEGYCAFADITGSGNLEIVHNNRRIEHMMTRQVLRPASGNAAYQVVGDVTGNGWPDIVQPANGGYWRNDGGNLTWVAVPAFTGGRFMQMLLADFDNDGHLDLFLLDGQQFSPSDRGLLFRNTGNGGFSNVSAGSGLANVASSDYGNIIAADFDNDGWQDLLVSGVGGSVRLYRNNRNLSFTAATGIDFGQAAGQGPGGWQSAAPRADVGDFDNDGKLDIIKTQFLSNVGLFRNLTATDGARWMKVRVRGGGGNSDGIGASVRWYRPGTNVLVSHMPVLAGEQHPQTHLHTGLGGNATIDLEVRFPNGGPARRFNGLASNQEVIVYANGCLIQQWQPGNGWPLQAPAGCGAP